MSDRFWSKVQRGPTKECWPWTGATKPKGYGNVRINKRYLLAHRMAWELTYGQIPQGMQVLHSCDNPICCNPNHLMIGTAMSNYIDMARKGRANSSHKNRSYGSNNSRSKLTTEQVADIRRRFSSGTETQTALAVEYGVSQPAVSAIILGKVRNHG